MKKKGEVKSRKDPKTGRVLQKGESYNKANENYVFRYKDKKGKERSIIEHSLEALRKREKQVLKDVEDNVNPRGETLNSIFERYIKTKKVKNSTLQNYTYIYEKFIKNELGYRDIKTLEYDDIWTFYNDLLDNKGFKINSLDNVHTILHPLFDYAVIRLHLITHNPTDGIIKEIKKTANYERRKKEALTLDEQTRFLNYLEQSKTYNHWRPLFTIAFWTGLRVSELCGLTWQNIDFKNKCLIIDHQLLYKRTEGGNFKKYIETPKKQASRRNVPFFTPTNQALKELHSEYLQRREEIDKMEIDGHRGFIFLNRFGEPYQPSTINAAIRRIVRDYNAENPQEAPLPSFSIHITRHSFATRLYELYNGQPDLAYISKILGHTDIQTTANYYLSLFEDYASEQGDFLNNRIEEMLRNSKPLENTDNSQTQYQNTVKAPVIALPAIKRQTKTRKETQKTVQNMANRHRGNL